MALQKYKVCPNCGEQNAPNLMECRKCETDLTGIKVVDSSAEPATLPPPETNSEPITALARVCDCGAQNPPQARKCKVCGEDISDIMPTTVAQEDIKPFTYELKAIDDDFSIVFDKPVIIIGRNAELKEYLEKKLYVSRSHAKLTIVAEKVFIENLSSTNKTYVNNEPTEDGTPFLLKNGDEIGLGGKVLNDTRQSQAAYFTFSIKS